MTRVFLDSSGLIGVLNTRDAWYAQANALWAEFLEQSRPLVTTSLVLVEVADTLAKPQFRQLAVNLRTRLLRSKRVEVVDVSEAESLRAWDLYRSRADKAWGMTDCTSMIVMQDRQIVQALTADRHFEQAEFEILVKASG